MPSYHEAGDCDFSHKFTMLSRYALHGRLQALYPAWAKDSSLERAFIALVKQLDEARKLDLSLLHRRRL